MPGGAPATGAGRYRGLIRFLAIDPETFPLAGVVGLMFASAGFILGRKFAASPSGAQISASPAQSHPTLNTNGGPNAGKM
ncbi:hypothetical protein M427DRAFT_135779 [Gonapodya prolifera JEL478]|uniref:Uncharacterized protein n=1 Tax=Gonapodya prolifera (strain JEL478) TaxID=1344416 RepID=A0A139AC71_GONPJ|nr:hypothetical protein M427DRAFT_135779 [Gonapodya prolifera JEL478]|eukprot:KXS14406.1 hypothetical protein M427DRAFT_135779 [Gonapodya prolifera JEL478]